MTKNEQSISINDLHELIELDSTNGLLVWKKRDVRWFSGSCKRTKEHIANNWNARYTGTPALNCMDGSGHLMGRINDKSFYAHRVVFAMTNKRWPDLSIDHIDGNPCNNKPSNLRDVSHAENHKNQSMRKNNTSGVTGVSFNKRLEKWAAHITVLGVYKHLGFFSSIEDASSARRAAVEIFNFSSRHGEATAPVAKPGNVVVIEHQDAISAFLASRDFGKEAGRIRAIIIEYIKFEAQFNSKEAA